MQFMQVIEMQKDGQQLYKADAVIKKQFTFSKLVTVYLGDGSASFRGHVVINLIQPVQGVSRISADQKYFTTTDAKGQYRIARITEGTDIFTFSSPGYMAVEQVICFILVTASKADIDLANYTKLVA